MTAPVVPKVKNILDTSNFEKQIQYAEKEKMDPFFGLAKGEDEVNQGGLWTKRQMNNIILLKQQGKQSKGYAERV